MLCGAAISATRNDPTTGRCGRAPLSAPIVGALTNFERQDQPDHVREDVEKHAIPAMIQPFGPPLLKTSLKATAPAEPKGALIESAELIFFDKLR